jgi:type I restriction enzyme R subunit
LKQATEQPDADPLDLLCHLAFDAPLLTRRERAEKLKRERRDFFDQFEPKAQAILEALIEKYAIHGVEQFTFPEVLKVSPISQYGNVSEIADMFGGAASLKAAVTDLQSILYAA